jgi:glucose/arabinose dehydrogenase
MSRERPRRFTSFQGQKMTRRLLLIVVMLWPLVPTPVLQLAEAQSCPTPSATVPRVRLQQIVTGLSNPLHLTHARDRTGRLFVVEQSGTIRIIQNNKLLPSPFLDIRSRVVFGGELGLFSVAFHPNYGKNGRFFVTYTTDEGSGLMDVVAEYRVSPNPNLADPTEFRILEVPQLSPNHHGGLNLFGPDGMLYIGLGDSAQGGDPLNNSQNLSSLLGKVLRIDVNGGAPYIVPPDNPFRNTAGARPEIWAYGFRNPWRFSFDRCDGRLFLGDVGESSWEEVDLVRRGGNYGWRLMEGTHCFNPPTGCRTAGLELPIHEYSHSVGCSVTGGFVYRGLRFPRLGGHYVFGDFCGGPLWALTFNGKTWTRTELLETGLPIASFGEDEAGELYLVDYFGSIYRIAALSP